MIRLTAFLALLPGLAWAHPGHLADLAGHDHVVAGIAIGLAGLAGLIGWLAGKGDADADAEDEAEAEAEEAAV